MPSDDHSPISAKDAKHLFADWKKRARDRARGVRRNRFDRADVAGMARWRRALARGARPDRGHRRSRPAGPRRRARRAMSSVWRKASICRIGRCAGPAPNPKTGLPAAAAIGAITSAGASGRGRATRPISLTAHTTRRSGRDAVDAPLAWQRYRWARGDGAGVRARWVASGAPSFWMCRKRS